AQYFKNKGGVAVNSAGNSGVLETSAASDTLITVSAISSSNTRTSWSSFGAYVDISAPGSGIYTTTMGGGYGAVNGTSFSSPITAGVLALMMSKNPNLTPTQLTNILLSTATDIGDAGWDQYYGRGRVNAAAVVQAAANAVASDSQAPTVSISGLVSGSIVKGIIPINVSAADNTAVTRVDLFVDGKLIGSDAMAPYAFSWSTSTLADGNHTLNAKAYDAAGNMGSASITVSVRNTIDSVAPVVTISNPLSGSILKANVSIQSSATDNIGVVSMVLYVDGVQKASSSSGALNYTLNSRKMSAGLHTMRVDAKDAAGNLGTKSIQVSK
ncbi:MAG: Ig-like domain-containing protein, partial [Pseudobdellovibrionaceae bacterium]